MTFSVRKLGEFLDAEPNVALVEVAEAKGSTPREKGAWMLVSRTAIFGTIGGGQLEFMAIDKARQLLASLNSVDVGAAPYPYPLPVKDGERGASTPVPPSPVYGERVRVRGGATI